MKEINIIQEDYEEQFRLMVSMDGCEEMIDEPNQEVFEILDCTIEENNRLRENLSIAKEIIRKHKWMMNTHRTILTQREKDIEKLFNVLKVKKRRIKKV